MSSSSSFELGLDDDNDFNDFDDKFENNSSDYYGDSVSLKCLCNITKMATPFIPMLLEEEQNKFKKRPYGGSVLGRRTYSRQRELANERIWEDYFADNAKYPLYYFRRRFRMRRDFYLRIIYNIERYDPYFKQHHDATGRKGLSSLQKMTAAIRMLATGCSADNLNEYIQIGESTALESLKQFCDAIIALYEDQYMRKPNESDITRLHAQGEARGFPGTHNDINILDRSHLFDDIINGKAPQCNYVVNEHQYNMGYYLTDGIYPNYATLIQTIAQPVGPKNCLFVKVQEAARKNVKRAFEILQARFAIVKGPARMWRPNDLARVMKICIILHNMIVEDERDEEIEAWQPPTNEAPQTAKVEHDKNFLTATLIAKLIKDRDTTLHDRLKIDLIEHIWSQHDNGILNFL